MRPGQQRMDGYGRHPHPGPGRNVKVIKKVSIQREPELKRTENALKRSKVEAGLTTGKTEEEMETEVCFAKLILLRRR